MAPIKKLSILAALSVVAFFYCFELAKGSRISVYRKNPVVTKPEDAPNSPYFPAIFALGDSTLDIGNNNHLDSPIHVNFLPYGVDYIPGRGSFSNGKAFMDFFAELSGLPPVHKYADLNNSNFHFYKSGINFASGGAGVFPATNCNGDTYCISLATQVEQFVNVSKKYSKKKLAKSLIVISVANNDYLQYFAQGLTIPIQEYISDVITGISSAIQKLYLAGARKLLLVEIGALGCTPSALASFSASPSNPVCVLKLNELVVAHNLHAETAVNYLTAAYTDLHIVKGKLLGFFENVTADPVSYGFKNASYACCGGGPFNAGIKCGFNGSSYCDNRDDFLFWDFVHVTQKTWAILAKNIFNGSPGFVSPYGAKYLADLGDSGPNKSENAATT